MANVDVEEDTDLSPVSALEESADEIGASEVEPIPGLDGVPVRCE
jgi:hypothetical protein